MFYKTTGKRVLDLLVASAMFLVLSPVFLFLFFFNLLYYRGNPFFFQERPGKSGTVFYILKFKTMNDRRDESGNLLPDHMRITTFGRLIRKTSLDEIPQLINVLKGEMSLIGPRPLLVEYLPLYSSSQIRRHEVRPGVTGWAQINGRNSITWQEKFQLDTWYVDNHNFFLDLKILILTFFNVLKGKGVSQKGHVSMGKFEGNEK
ncbi:sugar transferase [Algoriphagus sp. CAU 1675]|uniref:sugar transferase n=1 Tax=Algoriphagus sp. CAU 1675 TaxID=3032597 RepID=UPI0023DA332C|nr:sugar transferase [Algoriphagus sp. CAU 1675]MDF2158183.1 sugar transferase [Algoriphagus sp. CAU 1675]